MIASPCDALCVYGDTEAFLTPLFPFRRAFWAGRVISALCRGRGFDSGISEDFGGGPEERRFVIGHDAPLVVT